jgi:hypothetical protein
MSDLTIINYSKCKSISYEYLQKYKIPELKQIAKKYHLKVGGNKTDIIDRIYRYLLKLNAALCIQRTFRGYVVRYFFKNMGFKNRLQCVNECDSCTLEPLSNISFKRLFCFTDNNHFTYGFDLISLLTMYKKCNITNPYTREQMNDSQLKMIQTLGRFLILLFPNVIDKMERDLIYSYLPEKTKSIINTPANINAVYNIRNENRDRIRHLIFRIFTTSPTHIETVNELVQRFLTDSERTILYKLVELKGLQLEQRIRNVFIDIDLLGNYTQSVWFSSLDAHECSYFFRHLYDIWNYRGNLSPEIKKQICTLHDPFLNLRLPSIYEIQNGIDEVYRDFVQGICITVIENMVYGSADPEYRKIGTMHVLTALTIVSPDARNNLHWLYESVI